jgi:hypothetical protein
MKLKIKFGKFAFEFDLVTVVALALVTLLTQLALN